MNRIIKFRGKRIDTGEWVYGALIRMNDDCSIMSHDKLAHPGWQRFDVHPDTVGQFTGLADKKEAEIWEHDILSIDKGNLAVVIYKAPAFKPDRLYADMHAFVTCEVIGNIHDNPELISTGIEVSNE